MDGGYGGGYCLSGWGGVREGIGVWGFGLYVSGVESGMEVEGWVVGLFTWRNYKIKKLNRSANNN